jgi:hypothetical protein
MDSVKRVQIFEKFITKMRTYDWKTHDGSNFNCETDKLRFRFNSYNLTIDFKDADENSKHKGFNFSTSNNNQLMAFYHQLTEESLDDALLKVLDDNPDIKRELGLEDLLDE